MTLEQFWTTVSASFSAQLERLVANIPNLAIALVLAALGWVVARVVGSVVRRLIHGALSRLALGQRFDEAVAEGKLLGRIPQLLGAVTFWLVFLLFLAGAIEQLEIAALSGLLARLAAYWPNLLAGVVIALLGVVLGSAVDSWVSTTLGRAGTVQAAAAGRAARFVILLIAVVMAADQIGIESTFLIIAAGVILAVGTSGIAAAFALGSSAAVGNLIAAHYAGKRVAPGTLVRIGDVEGVVGELSPTTVVLRNDKQEILIPAKKFLEEVVVIENPTDGE